MALQDMNNQSSVPTYIIYRDIPPGEPYDPLAVPVFFPPKDSDELFDALRAKYPHLKTHSERMRDAIIEFLLEERQMDAMSSNVSPLMPSMPETTSPWQQSWPSMSSSTTLSSPETATVETPSLGYSPRPDAMSQGRHHSTAGSSEANTPALDKMTSVFSLSTTEQPKQRVRRKMTDAEKAEYRKRRIVKACEKCSKRKRKCTHNQPEMEIVAGNNSSGKVTKLRTSAHQSTTLPQKPATHPHISFDLEDTALPDCFNPSFAIDSYEDFTLMSGEPMPEITFDDLFKFDDVNGFDLPDLSRYDTMNSDAQLSLHDLSWSGNPQWLPVVAADGTLPQRLPNATANGTLPQRIPNATADGILPQRIPNATADGTLPQRIPVATANGTPSQVPNPSISSGLSTVSVSGVLHQSTLRLQDALFMQDGLLQDSRSSRGLSHAQLSDQLSELLPKDPVSPIKVLSTAHDRLVIDKPREGMVIKDWLRTQANNLEDLGNQRTNSVPGKTRMLSKTAVDSLLDKSAPTSDSSLTVLPGVGQLSRSSLLPSTASINVPQSKSPIGESIERLPEPSIELFRLRRRLSSARNTSLATIARPVTATIFQASGCPTSPTPIQELQALQQQRLQSVPTWLAGTVPTWLACNTADDGSLARGTDKLHHTIPGFTLKARSDSEMLAKATTAVASGPVHQRASALSDIGPVKSMALGQHVQFQGSWAHDQHWAGASYFALATIAILGALLLSQLLPIAIDSRIVVAAAFLPLAIVRCVSSALVGHERWATVLNRTTRRSRRIHLALAAPANALA